MGMELKRDEPLAKGVKRVALAELESAIASLNSNDLHEGIHDARKRMKKLRAIARLARFSIGEDTYRKANTTWRDAARKLSEVRDAHAIIETVKHLQKEYRKPLAAGIFDDAISHLTKRKRNIEKAFLQQKDVRSEVAATLRKSETSIIQSWSFANDFDPLSQGVSRIYKQGRQAMSAAYADPAPEKFHYWRKRVKYLMYQLRMLILAWPAMLMPLEEEIHRLSDILGDEHDLTVLTEKIAAGEVTFNNKTSKATAVMKGIIMQEQQKLREAAVPLGKCLFAEKPKAFTQRMTVYWKAWKY